MLGRLVLRCYSQALLKTEVCLYHEERWEKHRLCKFYLMYVIVCPVFTDFIQSATRIPTCLGLASGAACQGTPSGPHVYTFLYHMVPLELQRFQVFGELLCRAGEQHSHPVANFQVDFGVFGSASETIDTV